jgi:peptidoglycan-associated lipoprotein
MAHVAFAQQTRPTLLVLLENAAMILSLFASARAAKFAAVLMGGLALGACATTPPVDPNAAAGGFGAGGAATPGSTQDFVVNVGDRVFFESDSTDLTSTATATLDKQSTWLARYPRYTFTIEGHADERGTREYNFSLGARRAQAVRDYLASKGVPAGRMRIVSYGKERPVAVCNDISCWSQNRRSVTLLDAGAGS